MPEASLFVRKLGVKNRFEKPKKQPLEKLVRNAQQRYVMEALSVINCFAWFWYRDSCGQSPYCGDYLVCYAGCVELSKPCNTFGARSASEYIYIWQDVV